jgi:hypothetical protein
MGLKPSRNQSCLSSLYISTHNTVQNIIRGKEIAIPTSSRVSCGAPCGASVPQRTLSVPPSAVRHDVHDVREILWRGAGDAGENLTIFRGETREEAVRRLVQEGAVDVGAQLELGRRIRRGVIDTLLSRRKSLLDAMRPFVHRSQALGEGRSPSLLQPVLMSWPPARGESATGPWVWDLRQNRVSRETHPAGADHAGGAAEEAEGAEEVAARYLWEHQHPAECTSQKALVFMHDRAYWGFTANVHFMTVAFNFALAFNRTFLPREADHWNYGGRDCRHGWHCYFQNLSQCTERDVWEPYSLPVRMEDGFDYRGYLYRINTSESRVLYYRNVDGPWLEAMREMRVPDGATVLEWIPAQFRDKGLLWWRAQLTRYLLRPKQWVLEYINERRAALSLPESPRAARGIIGLHVRRGDKAYDAYQGSVFGSIDTYLAKARALNPDAIAAYVSTDDPSVISSLPSTARRHNMTMLHDDLEPRFNGTHVYAPPGVSLSRWPSFPGNDPNVNTTLYALETIKSIWLLTFACEHFVGTVTSCMSRLIYQFRIAFGQTPLLDEWTLDKDSRHPPGWFADP